MIPIHFFQQQRAQLALWAVIAIVVLVLLGIVFLFNRSVLIPHTDEFETVAFIDRCVKEHVTQATDILLPQGGFITPQNFKRYKFTEVEYLCENTGYFTSCVNQHPLLIREMQQEIYNYILPRIEHCFALLDEEARKLRYDVSTTPLTISVSSAPDYVYVYINRTVVVTKNEVVRTIPPFQVDVPNAAYDLAKIAVLIANEESQYCYTEYLGYMLIYPRFDIRKFALSDSTKIYTIKDKYSNSEMNIAIRGCAIPAGV